MKALVLVLLLLLFAANSALAQQISVAAGGDAASAAGSVAFTVGQVVYETRFGTVAASNEGVQQPYDVAIVTDVDAIEEAQADAFPNPVSNFFRIVLDTSVPQPISFRVVGSSGQIIYAGQTQGPETVVNTQHWASGRYLLQLATNIPKTINLIKTND